MSALTLLAASGSEIIYISQRLEKL